ncbi:hypothetical protein LCGC14_1515250 [marine sediment metagenome]|uniref:Uncharacterized protein n=1 Tax=marine sediment metagenome TaxID=412755 RepID=A0A0F9JKZ6_9ZZZZ
MATHIEINHDSGGTPATHYDSVTDTDGALSITGSSALGGSANGFQQDVDNPNFWIVSKTTSAPGTELRFRFRFKNSNLANLPGSGHGGSYIWRVDLSQSASSNVLLSVTLAWNASAQLVWNVVRRLISDGDVTFVSLLTDTIVDSGEHCIEIKIVRETADGNADGIVEIFLDGVSVVVSTTQTNFNTYPLVNRLRNNGNGGTQAVGITGDAYLDEFIIDTDGDADLGCLPTFSGYDLVLGGGQP